MDKIKKYEEAVLNFLNSYAKEMYNQDPSGVETFVFSDKEKHHYQLVRNGRRRADNTRCP